MKTKPVLREDGSLRGFEFPRSFFTQWPLTRLLRSIEGVSDVEAPWFSANTRFTFKFRGEPCVVLDENDRYWTGPADRAASTLDLTPVHEAFQAHRHSTLRRWAVNFDTSGHPGMSSSVVVATVLCLGYYWALDLLPRELLSQPVVAVPAIAFPFAFSGLLHYLVARKSGMPKLRQWLQTAGTAILAPLLAWFLAAVLFGKA